MKITEIRSDRIYRDMMTALPDKKENIYRKQLMKPFEYIKTKPFGTSDVVLITCGRENTTAYSMYKAMGFKETGRSDEEENELYFKV